MTLAVTGPRFPHLSIGVRIGDFDRPDFQFDVEPLVDTGTAIITLDADALVGRHVTNQFRVIFDHGTSIVVEP